VHASKKKFDAVVKKFNKVMQVVTTNQSSIKSMVQSKHNNMRDFISNNNKESGKCLNEHAEELRFV
jgi:hypothetical protein